MRGRLPEDKVALYFRKGRPPKDMVVLLFTKAVLARHISWVEGGHMFVSVIKTTTGSCCLWKLNQELLVEQLFVVF